MKSRSFLSLKVFLQFFISLFDRQLRTCQIQAAVHCGASQAPTELLITMKFFIVQILSFLIISASGVTDGEMKSPVTCSREGVVCEFTNNNVLDQVPGVPTLVMCRELCLDLENCQYLSYFDENATPVSGFCELFKSCETVNNCTNCYTENVDCIKTCGTNVIGDLSENVEDVIPYIESEMACKKLCHGNSKCTFYTYFLANDTLYPRSCFLLTEFVYPAQPCSTCITGPVDCRSGCSLNMNGESSKSLMLTDVSKTSEISINGLGGSCSLTLLVVGGGGSQLKSYGGGGGSGYLKYRSLQVSAGTLLMAQVGDQGQSSSVTISGGDSITAEPGANGQNNGSGGDGYSGGGGQGYSRGGDGGSDGGDGENGVDGTYGFGGAGTGEDVSLYTFITWSLGPGAGGQHYGNYGGGGGGGLMVDGAGPQVSIYQGAGFGGGGSGDTGVGLQGVILMEIN